VLAKYKQLAEDRVDNKNGSKKFGLFISPEIYKGGKLTDASATPFGLGMA
jgi:hypothetical protein